MKVRYLIKYTKESDIKFVSHLDLMRTIQRAVRRAELPVEFSKGFNPHMTLSIAQPLSVGMYSTGEYLDLVLVEEVDENSIIEVLNKNAPRGIRFLDATKAESNEDKKLPQAMALIDAARYVIKIKCTDTKAVEKSVQDLVAKKVWETLKKSKKGEKMVDIRPLIMSFQFWTKDDNLVINALVACGSKQNLSAQLLADYVKEQCEGLDAEKFVDIKREEMYAYKGKKLVELSDYFR